MSQVRWGEFQVSYSARGIPTYRLELWHEGLQRHRVITGREAEVVRRKAAIQAADWQERWAVASQRESERQEKADNRRKAADRNWDAQRERDQLAKILAATLAIDDTVDWESLKDRAPFPESAPARQVALPPPEPAPRPNEPDPAAYQPRLSLLDRLIRSRREKRTAEAGLRLRLAIEGWRAAVAACEAGDLDRRAEHLKTVALAQAESKAALEAWCKRRDDYLVDQQSRNEAVDRRRAAYVARVPDAVVEYCDMVLSASSYPDYFPKEWRLQYESEGRILAVDYQLPAPEALPTVKEVRYVASRDEIVTVELSEKESAKQYDSVLYQTTLRTIHELVESDAATAIDAVALNGIVTALDRATGRMRSACVLSVQVRKQDFLQIDLARVDPKTCFKSLKGVAASQLCGLAAVPPVLQLKTDDRRFVEAYGVAANIDAGSNLAAMPWEDFEHLIRELFEKEFLSTGGEVRVTQASRDGGVDAVAFDPDPIRGGKIVIQAKRYTHTVGVSAVRDLYGTLLNEGANKGILVTTSDYGPDAYKFAQGKPLVLLNGSNLLAMLEKHGTSARIDLAEARRLLS